MIVTELKFITTQPGLADFDLKVPSGHYWSSINPSADAAVPRQSTGPHLWRRKSLTSGCTLYISQDVAKTVTTPSELFSASAKVWLVPWPQPEVLFDQKYEAVSAVTATSVFVTVTSMACLQSGYPDLNRKAASHQLRWQAGCRPASCKEVGMPKACVLSAGESCGPRLWEILHVSQQTHRKIKRFFSKSWPTLNIRGVWQNKQRVPFSQVLHATLASVCCPESISMLSNICWLCIAGINNRICSRAVILSKQTQKQRLS